ncbi:MAG TPA: hypothetical protein VFH80_00470 [Solirubrobacteraceae bacterium]|nr:hypothetical protein [Solirubrobacteraceae bacterium]
MRARHLSPVLLLIVACAVAACGSSSSSSSNSQSPAASATTTTTASSTSTTSTAQAATGQKLGPEAMPLEAGAPLAPASTTTQGGGATVDGIQCAPVEQLAYHIHSHLQVYVNGQPRALPAAIGMLGPVAQQTAYGPFYGAQQCIYWLHTHASDGVIHIESPTKRIYTLGNFFDEWHQPLSRSQVAGAKGKVSAFLNGKAWKQDPRSIPLSPHASIQLDVGEPTVPAKIVSFAGTNL